MANINFCEFLKKSAYNYSLICKSYIKFKKRVDKAKTQSYNKRVRDIHKDVFMDKLSVNAFFHFMDIKNIN